MLKRKILDKLLEWKSNKDKKSLIIEGARQVGKSTLVRHDFSKYNRTNFDDRLTRMQAREEPKLFFLNIPKKPLEYTTFELAIIASSPKSACTFFIAVAIEDAIYFFIFIKRSPLQHFEFQ